MTRPNDELRTDIAAWVECRRENQELHLAFLAESSANVAEDTVAVDFCPRSIRIR